MESNKRGGGHDVTQDPRSNSDAVQAAESLDASLLPSNVQDIVSQEAVKPKMKFKLKRTLVVRATGNAGSKRTKQVHVRRDIPKEKVQVKKFSTSTTKNQAMDKSGEETTTTTGSETNDALEDLLATGGAIVSDTMMAIQSLLQAGNHGVVGRYNVPFVLKHMVHAIFVQKQTNRGGKQIINNQGGDVDLGASTIVASEFNALVRENHIRMITMFSTSAGRGGSDAKKMPLPNARGSVGDIKNDDMAILETQTYKREAISLMHQQRVREGTDLAQRFLQVIDHVRQSYVMEKELIELLRVPIKYEKDANSQQSASKDVTRNANPDLNPRSAQVAHLLALNRIKEARKDVDTLADLGFLKPKGETTMLSISSDSTQVYHFSLPGMGTACKHLAGGRSEVYGKVKRSMYGEFKISALIQRRLKRTEFNPMFHVDDLVAIGALAKKHYASGDFVKMPS
jgi:hypothetical protein